MAMTRPKSSQVEHRGETVQKVIDDITQEDGVLSTDPSWTDVPKLKGANANKQAQALANRNEYLLENASIKLLDYEALRAYSGEVTSIDITNNGIAGRFYCRGVVPGVTENGGTRFIDALGRLWERMIDGDVNASWFGFSASADSASNMAAIYASVAFAGAKKVIVHSDSDYLCGRIDFTDEDINIEYSGAGKLLKTTGTAININTGFASIDVITEFANVNYTIEGNTEAVTRIKTPSATSYTVGDVVKIVSDDLDAQAREGYTARLGEVAYVVAVASDAIYIPRTLEDYGKYITNPRIGRFKKSITNIKLPVIQSAGTNTSLMINVQARYKADVQIEIRDHGAQVVQFVGCVRSKVKFNSSTRGGSDGSLGYGFHDRSGTDNECYKSYGQRCRHMTTTGFTSTAENSPDLQSYGPTRNHTVIDAIAESAQNVPFDDHEGARRSQWINCTARGSLLGTNSYRAAFQLRGHDSRIVNPTVDASYEFIAHASDAGGGVHNISGGFGACKAVTTEDRDLAKPTVVLDNVTCKIKSANGGFVGGRNLNVIVNGGSYIQTGVSVASSRVWNANGARIILNNPNVYVSSDSASGFRWMQTANNGQIYGKMTVSLSSGTFSGTPRVFLTTDDTGRVDVNIDWLSAGRPTTLTSGVLTELRYTIRDYSVIPVNILTST